MTAPLKNARHERFAQELAKGKSQVEAYEAAGYAPDRGAATRLSANVSVQARVEHLKAGAAKRAEITAASLAERLLRIADKAEAKEDAPMLSVARASITDAAKLLGLVKTKHEHTGPNGGPLQTLDLTHATPEQLDALEAIFGPLALAAGDDEGNPAGEGEESSAD